MSKKNPSRGTIFSQKILQNADKIFWNYNDSKFSYLQLSHRSQHYMDANLKSQQWISKYFKIPQDYHILYLPQECAIPSIALNLNKYVNNNAIYLVNDKMSEFAYKQVLKINPQTLSIENSSSRHQQAQKFGNNKFYTYYNYLCLEQGKINIQLEPAEGQILICNLNYCAHYQTVDISKHGIVFFQCGYGFGLVGMDIVIIRKDLLNHHLDICPDMMCYEKTLQTKSIINTPYTLVPFMLNESIKYLIQNNLTHTSIKENLSKIKKQYEDTFGQSRIAKTESQGILIIKIRQNVTWQQIKQYGWKIKQGQLILILQEQNASKSTDFLQQIQHLLLQ